MTKHFRDCFLRNMSKQEIPRKESALKVEKDNYNKEYGILSSVYFGILIMLRETLWIRTGWASIAMYSFSDIEEGYFIIIFSGIVGILFWYGISHHLSHLTDENGLIIFISKHTFAIMINHLFVIFLIQGFILLLQKIIGNIQFNIDAYKSQEYFIFSNNPVVLIVLSFVTISIITGIQKGIEKIGNG